MADDSVKVVTPIITVGSVDDIRSFYTDTLGFTRAIRVVGEDGQLNMVTVVLGGAQLMFARSRARTAAS